jgi:hypothetical protein
MAGFTGFGGFTGRGGSAGRGFGPGSGGAGAAGSGGVAGATGGAGAAGSAGVAGATGTAGTTGTGGGGGTGGGESLRLFNGAAALIAWGPACTQEEGATGDRWCAFYALPPGNGSNVELYVLNVSRAAGGSPITCAAGDAACFRLTDDLHDPTQDRSRGTSFQGDTLVYYDNSLTPHAWRPGMTAGRPLATVSAGGPAVFACTPSIKGPHVICHREPPTPPTGTVFQHDLLAGQAGPTAPLLTFVETVITGTNADSVAGQSRYSYGFPHPGSGYMAWTARPTETAPETLRMQRLGDDASRVTVAEDVHDWGVNPAGTRWYWLSQFDARTDAGILHNAPFPGGASPVTVANVVQYGFPTDHGLVITTSGDALLSVADPVAAPTTTTTLDSAVLGFVAIGAQGHVAYAKTIGQQTGFIDLYVKPWTGGAGCTLSAAPSVPIGYAFFTPDGKGVVWMRGPAFDAVYTRLSDCSTVTIGPDVFGLDVVGNRAVLFLDEDSNVWARRIGPDQTIAGGAPIMVGASVRSAVPVGDLLVFSVNGTPSSDGIYLRAF